MEWMLKPYRRLYALIAGRASRQEFWMFVLLNVIVAIGFIVLFMIMIGGAALSGGDMSQMGMAMAGAGMVTMIVLMVPMYAWGVLTAVASFGVTIRRLHDLNLSGWLYLPFLILGVIPFLGFLVWIAFIVVMCLKGTSGPNKYGEDPTIPSSGAAVFA